MGYYLTGDNSEPDPFYGPITQEQKELLGKVKYRGVQLLRNLGELGGALTARKPLLALIKLSGDTSLAASSYNRLAPRLEDMGLVSLAEKDELSEIKLTDLGKECIAQLKTYPHIVGELKPNAEKIAESTSYHILNHIIEHAVYIDEDGVYWIRGKNAQTLIVQEIAGAIGVSYDAAVRRLHDLRERKGYTVDEKQKFSKIFEKDETKRNGIEPVVNIGVTPEGQKWVEKVKEKIKEESEVHDREKLDEVFSMTHTAIELADATDAKTLASQLREKYEVEWLLDLTFTEFEDHYYWLKKTLERLHSEYEFDYGKVYSA